MQQFLLIFRRDMQTKELQPSPQEMEKSIKKWQDWIAGLTEQKKFVSPGNRLMNDGKVLKKGGLILNGPYAEIKESIGGFIVIQAADLDEATEIAKGCPILLSPWDGSVEVRMVLTA